MHLSQLRTITNKTDYSKKVKAESLLTKKPKILLPITDLVFPTALTNIIKLNEPLVDSSIKLIHYIDKLNQESNQRLGYIVYDHASEPTKDSYEDGTDYYKALHRSITSRIKSIVKPASEDTYIHYDKWRDKENKESHIFFVNPHGSDADIIRLKELATYLSGNQATINPYDSRNLFNALIALIVKLTLIHDLNADSEAMTSGQVNVNNTLLFLVDVEDITLQTDSGEVVTEGKKPKKIKTAHTLYHALAPEVNTNLYNEIVTTLSYQRYRSDERDPNIINPQGMIDIFIPNPLPTHLRKFSDQFDRQSHLLIKDPANEGKRVIKFIDTNAINKSKIFYEESYVELVLAILKEASVDCKRLPFDPEWRLRPFKCTTPLIAPAPDLAVKKDKLVIIVGVNQTLIDNEGFVNIQYTPKKEVLVPSKKRKGQLDRCRENDITVSMPFSYQAALNAYTDYLRDTAFSHYDVEVVSFADISYDSLDQETRYLFIQDQNPPNGYWSFCDDKIETALQKKFGDDWLSHISLNFFDDTIKIVRERDFFKLYQKYKRSRIDTPQSRFYCDPYTMWKIKQFEVAIERGDKNIIQGHHLPPFYALAKNLIDFTSTPEAQLVDTRFKPVSTQDQNYANAAKTFSPALTKMTIDVEMKAALANEGAIRLYNEVGGNADLSAYQGSYRCYYVVKPKGYGKKEIFFASQIDFTIIPDGIDITEVSILEDEYAIRYAERFAISESSVKKLFNDSFYMVNDVGEVLTCYTDTNVVRPLFCDVITGTHKSMKALDYFNNKLWGQQASSDGDVDVAFSRRKGSEDASALAFHTLNSMSKPKDFGQLIINNNWEVKKVGGQQWLYVKENKSGMLSMFLTQKDAMNDKQPKSERIYNLLLRDKQGSALDAASSTMALLYIDTMTFHVARVNSFSMRSILHSIAKIALSD